MKKKREKTKNGSEQNVPVVVQNKRKAKRKYQMLDTRRKGKIRENENVINMPPSVYIWPPLGTRKKEGEKRMNCRLHNCQQSLHI